MLGSGSGGYGLVKAIKVGPFIGVHGVGSDGYGSGRGSPEDWGDQSWAGGKYQGPTASFITNHSQQFQGGGGGKLSQSSSGVGHGASCAKGYGAGICARKGQGVTGSESFPFGNGQSSCCGRSGQGEFVNGRGRSHSQNRRGQGW